ncbi:Na+/H+ antiporter NhaA [Gaoshiqia sp. Z1-71]|uniref:Na+/H+ antiporter NhaA n=1 Tax=Gaoshiqia hydrogeniformans TaxID=3290090 RepID=UPI003BF84C8A
MIEKFILSPIQKFIKTESLSGILLFVSTIIALVWANSALGGFYESVWQYKIGIDSENFRLVKPLLLWINDGLMAIFFFLIGLEIKREILVGELNSMKKASLPIFAAIGGMIVPLSLYLLLNKNPDTANGWGIPMATDIAFSLAILQLLGKRVPLGLKIFLTAFAIIDDIGAVLVIAVFYTGDIQWHLLIYAFLLLFLLYAMSAGRIYLKYIILAVGLVVWYLFLKAGIHPTIAGILLAFAIPVRQRIKIKIFTEKLSQIVDKIKSSQQRQDLPILSEKQIEEIDNLEDWTSKVQSPLQQLEHRLHHWVAYLIMPVFALSNAGVNFSSETSLDYSVSLAIAISLLIGKMVGITVFSWLSIRMKMAVLPSHTNYRHILGVSLLAGVGFTMSIFIANLAFTDSAVYLNSAKMGIIIGSLVSGIFGYVLLRYSKPVEG